MATTAYTFQSYPAVAKATFDCPSCGKAKRQRSFRAECTVNPFNKDENGNIRGPAEVRKQSRQRAEAECAQFLRSPLCATCENGLTYQQRKDIRAIRSVEPA